VHRRSCSKSPQWPKLIGAAASSLATLFVVRNFFPAEEKVRHSIRTDYAVGDDTFVRTMGHLLGPPLVEGNKITRLENGDQLDGPTNSLRGSRPHRTLNRHLRDVCELIRAIEPIRTFPTRFPVLTVDHVFVNHAVQPLSVTVHRSPLARIASDHFRLWLKWCSPPTLGPD
jgi:hypothetical protein